jgi:hypothetical protein
MMPARMLGVALALLAIAGCSASSSDGSHPISAAGGSAGSGGGSAGTVGDSGPVIDTGIPDTQPDASCGAISEKATATPLNLYIMLDKSSTMLGEKWDAAKAGLDGFLNDPDSTGIKVAINFFPRDPDSTPACDQNAYKTPKVAFAALPSNAGAILLAIDGQTPNGTSTPIYPALGGAILAGMEIVKNQPGDSAAVLLVTDGEPQGPAASCSGVDPQDPAAIASLAALGLQNKVVTFVVGLPGASQTTVNQIAAAGGSDAAIVVGTNNTKADFQTALATVRGKALPCEYVIPAKVQGGDVLPSNVNVVFTPGGSTEGQTIAQDKDCKGGVGWYYDTAQTRIILCPGTCDQFKADLSGKVDIQLGCKTVVK